MIEITDQHFDGYDHVLTLSDGEGNVTQIEVPAAGVYRGCYGDWVWHREDTPCRKASDPIGLNLVCRGHYT
jgi:hypothetical protein